MLARTQLLSLLGRPTRAPGWSLPRFVHIQAVAQLLKSSSPVKSIDLGDTCISDDGAQAWYGSMGRARRISDSVGRIEGIPFRHIVRCTAIWKDCLLSKNYLNRSTFCPKFIFSWTPPKKPVPGIFNGTYTWLLATPFCIYYVSSSWNSPIQNVHNIIVYGARKPGNIPQRSVMTIFIACMVPRWPVEYPQNPLVKFEQIVFSDVLGTVWFLLARRKLVF